MLKETKFLFLYVTHDDDDAGPVCKQGKSASINAETNTYT